MNLEESVTENHQLIELNQCHNDYYPAFSYMWFLDFIEIQKIIYIHTCHESRGDIFRGKKRGLTK